MARTKKSRKIQLMKEIKSRLRNEFHVTDKEIASGSFYYRSDAILPEDIVPFFESQYDIDLKYQDFGNWNEFAEKVANLVVYGK